MPGLPSGGFEETNTNNISFSLKKHNNNNHNINNNNNNNNDDDDVLMMMMMMMMMFMMKTFTFHKRKTYKTNLTVSSFGIALIRNGK